MHYYWCKESMLLWYRYQCTWGVYTSDYALICMCWHINFIYTLIHILKCTIFNAFDETTRSLARITDLSKCMQMSPPQTICGWIDSTHTHDEYVLYIVQVHLVRSVFYFVRDRLACVYIYTAREFACVISWLGYVYVSLFI